MCLRMGEPSNSTGSGSIGLLNGEQPGLRNPSVIKFPSASDYQAIGMAFAQETLAAPFANFAIENYPAGVSVEPKTDGGPNRAQWTRAICRRRMPLHNMNLTAELRRSIFREQTNVCGPNRPTTPRFPPNAESRSPCQRHD
jgi:hypothetical protein